MPSTVGDLGIVKWSRNLQFESFDDGNQLFARELG
jgi:hypothetical protein